MLGLQWKKTTPTTGSRQFVPVSNDFDSPVVAGAFKHQGGEDPAENKFKLANDGFHPGVFDHKTKTCVINDVDTPENDYYVLTKSSTIQCDWVPAINGNIPTGAIQCGFSKEGDSLYVGRLECEGRLLCGRIDQDIGHCEVTVLGKTYTSNEYEVLCLRSVPFGFTYNSLYGLRSSLVAPTICHMISNKLSIQSESDDNASSPFTPPPTPAITRTVTSTSSITMKKVTGLLNGSSSPLRKSPSPEPTPVQESTPPRPRKIEFPATPSTPETPASNGSVKSPRKKQRDSPNTKWQRNGKGYRLVRSPSRFSPLK